MIKSFSHLMSDDEIIKYINGVTNFNKSIVVELNGEIVGFYLLGDRQIKNGIKNNKLDKVYIDLNEYNKKIGLEGVALVVKDEYRGLGIGSKLKNYVKNLNIDYVWGLQYKDLNNLDMWLKRRKLAAERDNLYLTIEDFI
jgi:GNAT superfamily N-acetyltransferase